jgi:hypothetical protein
MQFPKLAGEQSSAGCQELLAAGCSLLAGAASRAGIYRLSRLVLSREGDLFIRLAPFVLWPKSCLGNTGEGACDTGSVHGRMMETREGL